MADYSAVQLKAMEEEAAKRVMEMSRRSKSHVMQSNSAAQKNSQTHEPHDPHHENHAHGKNVGKGETHTSQSAKSLPKKAAENNLPHRTPMNFLKSLDLKQLISGGEQSMLLLLIMILMSDNSDDDFLIYALIYIML